MSVPVKRVTMGYSLPAFLAWLQSCFLHIHFAGILGLIPSALLPVAMRVALLTQRLIYIHWLPSVDQVLLKDVRGACNKWDMFTHRLPAIAV